MGKLLGVRQYLPISDIIFNFHTGIQTTKPLIIQEVIEEKAIALAEVLLGKHAEQNLIDVISYSIREIGRNVYEHSRADRLSYVAQYWPTKSEVELCISDLGCGIYSSISQNAHLAPQNDLDAIGMCLLPGISCKGNVLEGSNSDHWANSGFGLYMIASLCALDGSIFVLSGDSGLFIRNGKRHIIEANFNGTLVRVKIRTDKIGLMSDMASTFVTAGRKIAKELTGMKHVTSSTASGMLKRHFEK